MAVAIWLVFPVPKAKLHRPSSSFIYSGDGRLLNCFISRDGFWRKPVKLADISPLLIKSVIATEDRWFYYHPGFNPISLAAAAIDNIRAGKAVRGGSTITMQIARMIEPKSRTVANKFIEILRAMQLELSYSKKELLEIYLNLVPYGGNIEGVGAASYLYFDKTPGKLTLSETAILTALPASPNDFRPDRGIENCQARRNKVLRFLNERKIILESDYEQALNEEIPARRVAPAVTAPHFCQSLTARYPDQPEIKTTIDFKIQITCEQLAANYHTLLTQKGIFNLSAVVIDNHRAELLAMIGSPDFGDINHHGQVNGALAPRSPGSALKPFVYALGFDKGLISPALKVEDLAINYSGYIPANYDDEYHGAVAVNYALINSLNVPAVNLTSQLGLKEVYELFLRGGISTLNRKYFDYGLPIILGSCEVTLFDLAALYSTFARDGKYMPVKLLKSDSGGSSISLFSPQTCYLITEILAELKRPDLPGSWEFTPDMPQVAWKTGTSYGRRDAWAIGYNPDYTIGVWAGNFSAEGSIAIVGADIAVPLMIDIFNQLSRDREKKWFKIPSGIEQRLVCAVSGQVAGENCRDKIVEHYIPGISPAVQCTVHKKILVDQETGYQLCKNCSHGKKTVEKIIENWPPRLSAWLAARGIIGLIPSHNPKCQGFFAGEAPVITSPENEAVYMLRANVPLEFQKILFEASTTADNQKLFWFLDGQLLTSCDRNGRIFYTPEKGEHRLICSDNYGRSSSILFKIQ
jgi:penicillin-binding protein 1C